MNNRRLANDLVLFPPHIAHLLIIRIKERLAKSGGLVHLQGTWEKTNYASFLIIIITIAAIAAAGKNVIGVNK